MPSVAAPSISTPLVSGASATSRVVVGTCGHVDHGKTSLVRALTGVDTDRWQEEKRRGITIDLGFAAYRDGEVGCAFVDVPGHHAFVHNMLAGAAGVDAVLLVVAADEGVMPQTREHLQICQLLGIRRGIIALTRTDLVEEAWLELVREEVAELTRNTFLGSAPVVPVSVVSGEGLAALRKTLRQLIVSTRPRTVEGPFRMPLDRVFLLKGFGVIVTGTVTAGSLRSGESFCLYPAEKTLRQRGLHVHERTVERIEAGQRAGINVVQIEAQQLKRGDQLAEAGSLLRSSALDVQLTLLAQAGENRRGTALQRGLASSRRVRLHLGTQEVLGRLMLFREDPLLPGETELARLRLEHPVAARRGDRFILRGESPPTTLGGGEVIDPAPCRLRRDEGHLLRPLLADLETQIVQLALLERWRGIDAAQGAVRTDVSLSKFRQAARVAVERGVLFDLDTPHGDGRYVHRRALDAMQERLGEILAAYHGAHGHRAGASLSELRGQFERRRGQRAQFDATHFERLMAHLVGRAVLAQADDGRIRLPEHRAALNPAAARRMDELVARIAADEPQPLRRVALLESLAMPPSEGDLLLRMAVELGRLVRVRDDLYYTPAGLRRIQDLLRREAARAGQITVIDFKAWVGITRKHAVDLLEHFDAIRYTLRVGDHRLIRSEGSENDVRAQGGS